MGENNMIFLNDLPPLEYNSCLSQKMFSLISASLNHSNNTEISFSIHRDPVSVFYTGMDQHETPRLWDSLSSCCSYLFSTCVDPSPPRFSTNNITYKDVCQNFYKLEVKDFGKKKVWGVGVCYVMLFIYYLLLLFYIYWRLIVYKFYDIPYCMLCYFDGV